MVHQEQINISTKGNGDMHDLTEKVNQVVKNSGIQQGMVNVFNVGSTGAIGAIEFEPGLPRDLPSILNKLIPPSRDYFEDIWYFVIFWFGVSWNSDRNFGSRHI